MSKASKALDATRAARNRARRRFDSRMVRARQDITPETIVARATGDLKAKARDTFDEAVEIASENRVIVAGTLAALALWFLRKPILSWLEGRLVSRTQQKDIDDEAG